MKPQAISISTYSKYSLQMFMALAMALAVLVLSTVQIRAAGAPVSFADLADQTQPAVVNITTSTMVASGTDNQPILPDGSPFEDFFRDFLDREGGGNGQGGNDGAPNRRRSQALGSGFVVSEDGFIVTNNHVIEGADEILIEFFDGSELPAVVVGTDPNTDIAVLKVEADMPLPFVQFGDSDVMRVGDWVLAVGNPLGQGFSVSAGIISARKRELSGTYDDFIQTDAAINRGNSGGPLFNMDGQVIGVNTAILSPNGGSIGIGFSMASNVVGRVVDQLREFGETRRGWLGVRIQDVSPDMAEAMGLESTAGALVTNVPNGPAADGGVLSGDLILSFDGRDVIDTGDLVRQVGNAPVGKAIRLTVLRDGQTQTLKVTLGRREDAVAAATEELAEEAAPEIQTVLGMELGKLTDEIRTELGLNPGDNGLVIVAVADGSQAAEKGLLAGDVITEAGQQKVETIAGLQERIAVARDGGRRSILLLVRRGGEPRFIALSLGQ